MPSSTYLGPQVLNVSLAVSSVRFWEKTEAQLILPSCQRPEALGVSSPRMNLSSLGACGTGSIPRQSPLLGQCARSRFLQALPQTLLCNPASGPTLGPLEPLHSEASRIKTAKKVTDLVGSEKEVGNPPPDSRLRVPGTEHPGGPQSPG